MREIKFRALAIVNDKYNNIKVGDFVYGHYIESGCDAPCIIFGDGEQIEVDKQTLGQLTGLTDMGGDDIYEGDVVVRYLGGDGRQEDVEFTEPDSDSVVTFDNVTFFLDNSCIGDWFRQEIQVIGNIHQSPELLEQ